MRAVSSHIDFPKTEEEILALWSEEKTFEVSNKKRLGAKEYSFYDGPPFANGLPHYGHILGQTIKDIVPRYWNMRGFAVDRRFGWDCHGLPVEFEVEKTLGLAGRKAVLDYGVKKFNDACRSTVLHYTSEWQKTISRLGRWVDWNNQYRTMDKEFMESVWWVISQLSQKNLVYRDLKIVAYSPRISAVLSNFEANLNYKDVQDPSVTIKFQTVADPNTFILAWTTTPWTLPSNLGLNVGPEIVYVLVKELQTGLKYYLAEERLDFVFKNKDDVEILQRLTGIELSKQKYVPLFEHLLQFGREFSVYCDPYVSTESGTGIVHCAPAFGEDDFRIGKREKLEIYDPLDVEGKFTSKVEWLAGLFFKDADKEVIKKLKEKSLLLKHETLVHSYPHCDRTEAPLMYRAIPTWYVRVEAIKNNLVENNQKIRWVPEHLKAGRMGQWLENARDWAISRNRFWGTPLPIWISDQDENYWEVIGSIAELEQKSGQKFSDIHKHFVDEITWKCPNGGTMRRVPEVFDCWFESGSMPYAQMHYPFENSERFKNAFPADFIAEGQDQTRGWFYTLSVLSSALFEKPAFKNVVVNGIVLAADGKKMSKRLKNYTAPDLLLDQYGADSVRLYMINSAVLRGDDLKFSDEGVKETTRSVLLPVWNALSFLATYAEADGWKPNQALLDGNYSPSQNEFDQWIVSRIQTLKSNVHEKMEVYRLDLVVPELILFIDELTNWYIRLNRRRFWSTAAQLTADTTSAYETLFHVMHEFAQIFSPFAPFISDKIFRVLTESSKPKLGRSVHLCDMPMPNDSLRNQVLERRLGQTFSATALGRSIRAKLKLKTRQPLSCATVICSDSEALENIKVFEEILLQELNVKKILYSQDEQQFVTVIIKPNLKELGRRLGGDIKTLQAELSKINSVKELSFDLAKKLAAGGSYTVNSHSLKAEDFLIERNAPDGAAIASDGFLSILLDTSMSPELIEEGISREAVNRIQKARKDANFNVSDRIRITIKTTEEISTAVEKFKDYICSETLATDFDSSVKDLLDSGHFDFSTTTDIDGQVFEIGLLRVDVNPAGE